VEAAEAHCAARGLGFEPVRTEIGVTDYRIAFRCPRRLPDITMPATIGIDTLERAR